MLSCQGSGHEEQPVLVELQQGSHEALVTKHGCPASLEGERGCLSDDLVGDI